MVYILLAVAAGAFVQGATGMGFALVAAPVMGMLAPELLPASLLVLMLPLNAHVAWRERGALDLRGSAWITAGRVVGTFGGLWVLLALSTHHLSVFIGVATLAAAVATLIAPAFSPGRSAYVTTGVVTGITETATGIGGPPLALVYQHMPVATLRASVALCFLVGEVVSLVVLAASGKLGMAELAPVAGMLPALFAGMLVSHWIHRRVNERFLRSFVLAFAIVSGVVILVNG